MVLFYAWTDTQLINYVNVKCNFYKDVDADLLIFRLSRISTSLVEEIRKEQIFSNIIFLDMPKSYLERKRKGIKESIDIFFNIYRIRSQLTSQLKMKLENKTYDLFFTAAFWSESLYVYKYITKYNRQIDIFFIEEGLSAYNSTKNWLFRTVPSFGIRAEIRNLLYYGLLSFKTKKRVKGLYLYCPEESNGKSGINLIKMPPITWKNFESFNIIKEFSEKELKRVIPKYLTKEVIYIADAPKIQSKKPYQNIDKIVKYIIDCLDNSTICVKLHPLSQKSGIFFPLETTEIDIDNNTLPIELILFQCNLDNKLIITNTSTGVFGLIHTFHKHPYILFTYKICAVEAEKKEMDELVEKMRKQYIEKERIMIPKNEKELGDLLEQWKRRST